MTGPNWTFATAGI